MPRARNRTERSQQVFNYLLERWPSTTHPVNLRLVESMEPDSCTGKEPYADAGWDGNKRRLVIRLNLKRCRDTSTMVDTLLHEYAHCMDRWDWRSADHPPHGNVWGAWYSDIYTDFFDDDGWSRSKEYPV